MKLIMPPSRSVYRFFCWTLATSVAVLLFLTFPPLFIYPRILSFMGGQLENSQDTTFFTPVIIASVASIITAMVSFIGLLFSSAISWKKEKRERKQFELDLQKKQLEIEMLRSELINQKISQGEQLNETLLKDKTG